MKIVLIGTGNAATVLGRRLKAAGHQLVQVFGRDSTAASALAYELDTESTNYWNVVNRTADLYLLAVSDLAIEAVVADLRLTPDKIVVHTAAALPRAVLEPASPRNGVLYPLQSLVRDRPEVAELPLLIDGSDEPTLRQIERLAESISGQVMRAGDEERLKLHLAAVLCNNFVNHLFTLASSFCRAEGLDFRLLLPLISETAARLRDLPPEAAQTGPARRGDTQTMRKHEELLEADTHLQSVYRMMTESIGKYYGVSGE